MPATNANAKRNAAALLILDGEDAYVVDLRIHAANRAAGYGDLELARQVGEVPIADKESVHLPNQRRHIVMLIRIDSGDRTTDYVAHGVAAGIGGGQSDAVERLQYRGDIADPDPVKLNILPDCDIGKPLSEPARQIGDCEQLARIQLASRDSDPNHEVSVFGRTLGVDAVPFE